MTPKLLLPILCALWCASGSNHAAELRARIEQWRKETNANMPRPL